jgi:hypothetical protein
MMNTQSTQNETQDTVNNSAYNPFPEPQTIPSGWDPSGLFFALQPVSDEQADDSSES